MTVLYRYVVTHMTCGTSGYSKCKRQKDIYRYADCSISIQNLHLNSIFASIASTPYLIVQPNFDKNVRTLYIRDRYFNTGKENICWLAMRQNAIFYNKIMTLPGEPFVSWCARMFLHMHTQSGSCNSVVRTHEYENVSFCWIKIRFHAHVFLTDPQIVWNFISTKF